MGSVKQKLTIEVDVPEGYEVTGEYRPPKEGESFLSEYEIESITSKMDFIGKRLILRKTKRYREPMLPADAGKKVEVRNLGDWVDATLTGFQGRPYNWIALTAGGGDIAYRECRIEVTDED